MPISEPLPQIIQGGMGVAVSSWRLANAVSRAGQLGVVSGSGMDTVLVRRLQDGDPDGHIRRAMEHFPIPRVADDVLRRYFNPRGRAPGAPYKLLPMLRQVVSTERQRVIVLATFVDKLLPMLRQVVSTERQRVIVLATFVEAWLAREGHDRPVGINLLTKVQMPNMPSLYGAMLAGAHVVLMGAGIPREIPGILDAFAEHRAAEMRFEVEGLARDEIQLLRFDPAALWPTPPEAPLTRPRFIPIVAAASLATTLARKSNGRVDGFVVEGPTAGGHNAPPRGDLRLNDRGEPVYGDRDIVDLTKLRELGLPFWLAGGTGSPDGLRAALAEGATGIQVGTLFAYCNESGLAADVKRRVLAAVETGEASVRTDPRASPTGYPFKVVELAGDQGRPERTRICDIGLLRTPARVASGRIVYRCPAEPVADYVAKGGDESDTVGRQCLCNGLMAGVGYAQTRATGDEPPFITSGDDLLRIPQHLRETGSYSANDVIAYLLS